MKNKKAEVTCFTINGNIVLVGNQTNVGQHTTVAQPIDKPGITYNHRVYDQTSKEVLFRLNVSHRPLSLLMSPDRTKDILSLARLFWNIETDMFTLFNDRGHSTLISGIEMWSGDDLEVPLDIDECRAIVTDDHKAIASVLTGDSLEEVSSDVIVLDLLPGMVLNMDVIRSGSK